MPGQAPYLPIVSPLRFVLSLNMYGFSCDEWLQTQERAFHFPAIRTKALSNPGVREKLMARFLPAITS
jgi:hypothetical protein